MTQARKHPEHFQPNAGHFVDFDVPSRNLVAFFIEENLCSHCSVRVSSKHTGFINGNEKFDILLTFVSTHYLFLLNHRYWIILKEKLSTDSRWTAIPLKELRRRPLLWPGCHCWQSRKHREEEEKLGLPLHSCIDLFSLTDFIHTLLNMFVFYSVTVL